MVMYFFVCFVFWFQSVWLRRVYFCILNVILSNDFFIFYTFLKIILLPSPTIFCLVIYIFFSLIYVMIIWLKCFPLFSIFIPFYFGFSSSTSKSKMSFTWYMNVFNFIIHSFVVIWCMNLWFMPWLHWET